MVVTELIGTLTHDVVVRRGFWPWFAQDIVTYMTFRL